jgi:hypothetical protein
MLWPEKRLTILTQGGSPLSDVEISKCEGGGVVVEHGMLEIVVVNIAVEISAHEATCTKKHHGDYEDMSMQCHGRGDAKVNIIRVIEGIDRRRRCN